MNPPKFILAEIPLPPSVNALFRNNDDRRGGRHKTLEYREWINEAAWTLIARKCATFLKDECPLRVSIRIYGGQGWNTRRDIDNCMKPVLDVLVTAKKIPGDTCLQVSQIAVEYIPPTSMPLRIAHAEVEVFSLLTPGARPHEFATH